MRLQARILLTLLFSLLLVQPGVRAQQQPVVLELVLAMDTSTSVDGVEFELQRQGLSHAFAHPDFIAVIEGMGNIGIAVTLVEWAGLGRQKTVVGWTHVNSAERAVEFAARVRTAPRLISGMTDIGGAIRYAASSIENNGFSGSRAVIDISGDGSGSIASSRSGRDAALGKGITINGLVIYNEDYDLGALAKIELREHYLNYVIGGPGAFLMEAASFKDFRNAILNKLIREVMGSGVASLDRR